MLLMFLDAICDKGYILYWLFSMVFQLSHTLDFTLIPFYIISSSFLCFAIHHCCCKITYCAISHFISSLQAKLFASPLATHQASITVAQQVTSSPL